MQSMQAAVVSAAHQRPAALLREVPSARRPPSAGKMPNPPEESPRDFLLLSEFSEQVGPIPVMIIPRGGAGNFETSHFSVRIMSSDFQTISGKFSICQDTQIILSELKEGVYAYVHYFCLNDLSARGYIRQFCLSYLSPSLSKLTNNFEDLQHHFSEVTRMLKCGNHRVFGKDLEHRLADLEHTADVLKNEEVRKEDGDLYSGYDFGEQDVPERDPDAVRTANEETKEIMAILTREMSLEENQKMLVFIEKQQTTYQRLQRHQQQPHHERHFGPRRQDGFTMYFPDYTNSIEPKTSPVEDHQDMLASSEESIYRPQRVMAHIVRKFERRLRPLEELSQRAYGPAMDKLEMIVKTFGRSEIALEMEKDESCFLDPCSSLLAIGRVPQLNMLQDFQLLVSQPSAVMRPCPYQLHSKNTWGQPLQNTGTGVDSDGEEDEMEELVRSGFNSSFVKEGNALNRMPLYLNAAMGLSRPHPSSVSFSESLPLSINQRDAAESPPGSKDSSKYNTPQTFSTPECGHTPPSPRAPSFLDEQGGDEEPGPIGSRDSRLKPDDHTTPFPTSEAPPTASPPSDRDGGRNVVGYSYVHSVRADSTNSQESWTVVGEKLSVSSLSPPPIDASSAGGSLTNGYPVGGQAVGYSIERLPRERSLTGGSFTGGTVQDLGRVEEESREESGSLDRSRNLETSDRESSLRGINPGTPPTNRRDDPVIKVNQQNGRSTEESGDRVVNLDGSRRGLGVGEEEEEGKRTALPPLTLPTNVGSLNDSNAAKGVGERRWGMPLTFSLSSRRGGEATPEYHTPSQIEPPPFPPAPGPKPLESQPVASYASLASLGSPLSPRSVTSMFSGEKSKWPPIMDLYSRGKLPFISSVDHIEGDYRFKPGRGVLTFCKENPCVKDLLFCLLHGRPLIIVGLAKDENLIRRIVRCLWVFVPGQSSREQVVLWQTSPLEIRDLSRVKLMGLCCPGSLSSCLGDHLKRYVSYWDCVTNTLCTPSYKGEMLKPIVMRTANRKNEEVFLTHIQSVLADISMKAYVYYHAHCINQTNLIRHSPEVAARKCHTVTSGPSIKNRVQFLDQLGVREGDMDIIEYFVEVVREQQLAEWRAESCLYGNPQDEDGPVRLKLQLKHCHTENHCKPKRPY